MRYESFVLDYDSTYDIPDPDNDMFPTVYFIPEGTTYKACQLADLASETFHQIDDERAIGDIFEKLLVEYGIAFLRVGDLQFPFEERQENYLADSICHVVV